MSAKRPKLDHLIIGLVALSLAVRAALALHGPNGSIDFRPMYCAGQAILAHADPYLVEPLKTCERAYGLDPATAVMPAPVPGYVLVLFAGGALLPYAPAMLTFSFVSIAGFFSAAFATARLCGSSMLAATAGLFWACGFSPLNLGQLSVIALAALVIAALAAERRRWTLAAVATCATLVQPQLGLPAAIALAVFAPQARRPLAVGVGILAALSFIALGPAGNVRYFTSELPRHAVSEAAWPFQMSLTWALTYAGVPQALAARAGSISYLASVALGLVAARSFARRGTLGLAILVPSAFGLFGGTFIHLQQIATMTPLALMLVARTRVDTPIFAALGALLVGFNPFLRPIENVAYLCCGLYVIGALRARSSPSRWQIVGEIALTGALAGMLFIASSRLPALDQRPQHLDRAAQQLVARSGPLASDQWKTAADLAYAGKAIGSGLLAAKATVWLGIVLVLGSTLVVASDTSRLSGPAVMSEAESAETAQSASPFAPSRV